MHMHMYTCTRTYVYGVAAAAATHLYYVCSAHEAGSVRHMRAHMYTATELAQQLSPPGNRLAHPPSIALVWFPVPRLLWLAPSTSSPALHRDVIMMVFRL